MMDPVRRRGAARFAAVTLAAVFAVAGSGAELAPPDVLEALRSQRDRAAAELAAPPSDATPEDDMLRKINALLDCENRLAKAAGEWLDGLDRDRETVAAEVEALEAKQKSGDYGRKLDLLRALDDRIFDALELRKSSEDAVAGLRVRAEAAEKAKREAEERRAAAAAEARRVAAAEEARRAAKEEAKARKAAKEAKARKAAEEKARQEAEEAARKAEEKERQEAEEAARKAKEEKERQEAEEAARKAAAEKARQEAEEAARKAAEKARQEAEEAARKASDVNWMDDRTRPAGARSTVKIGWETIALRWCPAGFFPMGSPVGEAGRNPLDELRHRVSFKKGFWMGETEVTIGLWKEIMDGTNPSLVARDEDRPVENVSWEDCQTFLQRLNDRAPDGWQFSLPTEAQWEYACRAGSPDRWGFVESGREGVLGQMGWYGENSGNATHPVGKQTPNRWGLFDMHGNVWEWCQDCYDVYSSEEAVDPVVLWGVERVLRGGAYWNEPKDCRAAHRDGDIKGSRRRDVGFRLAAVRTGN